MKLNSIKAVLMLLTLLISCDLFKKENSGGASSSEQGVYSVPRPYAANGQHALIPRSTRSSSQSDGLLKDFDLTTEEKKAINYLKDTLMNFKHFIPGVYRKDYKTYTSDEFYSLLDSFGKDGIKKVAGSIVAVLNAQAEAEEAVSKIGDLIEREVFKQMELRQNWYKRVLKVAFDDPSLTYNDLAERNVKVKDVFEKGIKRSAELSAKIYDTFNLDLYEKRVIRYILALSIVHGEDDDTGVKVTPYTKYEIYELLASPPLGAANIKNAVENMKKTIKALHAAEAAIGKIKDETRKNNLKEQFNRQKDLYDQELKPVLKDPDKLYAKLTSDIFEHLSHTVAGEFDRIKQEARSKS
ncbi:BTA121 domain-containing protein surface lipoprotein [Borrelia hermsii]|uniref:Lipoprotein n=2 Tax=Borrelia hermsii TaxID=140 RepID=T1EC70_BORHE|nr:hypothetical protein [Borrelia hermsii]ADN26268.1 hypothetical protein BHA011 [Borrelia hermsii]AMR75848.1 hypothetical protein A0V01_04355 [Borrelia hermsii]ANA43652.1 putative lipoprotein [Borrelia hermsii HS1]UPA08445.1 hypothetical protein bhDAH_001153 [Borrelia hermsii DAH]